MKKIFFAICLVLVSIVLVSCGGEKEDLSINENVTVMTPYGTPYLAIGGLLDTENVTISAVNGADPIKAALIQGSSDIVIAPINLGAMLYGKGNSKYILEAVITMNNAYIVTESTNNLASINDLSGQKVLGFGQTGIPGSMLKKVYADTEGLNIEDVDFSLASSTATYAAFQTSEQKYALMSEPEISKMKINDQKEIKTLDLCAVLGTNAPQACIFVNPNSMQKEDVQKVLKLIEKNVSSLNSNPSAYADKVMPLDRTFEAMGKEVIKTSIPKTNIVYKKANSTETKTEVESILNLLGVALPDAAFYRA